MPFPYLCFPRYWDSILPARGEPSLVECQYGVREPGFPLVGVPSWESFLEWSFL